MEVSVNDRRKILQDKLPDLAVRIFALRNKTYPGLSYHWSLMKALGGLLARVYNYEGKKSTYTHYELLVEEVIFEDLLEEVSEAESASFLQENSPPNAS